MRGGIQRRLTFIISLCVLIPLLLVWGVALWLGYRAAEQSARERQMMLAELVASDFTHTVERAENQLFVFGNSLIRTTELLEITNDRVFPVLISSQLFSEIGVYNTEGLLLASAFNEAPTQLPATLAGEELLAQVLKGESFYGGLNLAPGPNESPDPNLPARLRIARLIEGSNSRQVIVVGDIDMEKFAELAAEHESHTAANVLILTPQGQVLIAPDLERMRSVSAEAQLSMLPQDGAVADYTSITGIDVMGARGTLEGLNWVLLLESPAEEIYADVRMLSINLLAIVMVAIPLVIAVGFFAGGRIARPIHALHNGVELFGRDANAYTPVRIHTNDELTALAEAFNTTVERLRESRAELEQSNERLEEQVQERTARLQHLLQEVEEKSKAQEELLETVRRLSLPVIPLMRGMVMMPLVGEITSERASDLAPRLLHAVEEERARIALLDISGVPIVDHNVAHALVNSARAVRLIGAEAVLVGIRPEVSESLVSLGIPLNEMLTAATLEQGIALGVQRLNGQLVIPN